MKLYRLLFFILITYAALFIYYQYSHDNRVLGVSTSVDPDMFPRTETSENKQSQIFYNPAIKTVTAFDQKEIKETVPIAFETRYEDDKELEYGKEEVKEKGITGLKTHTYHVIFWQDDIIDKTLLATKIDEPKDEVISVGKKIVWKMYSTPDVGRVKYWHKLHVFATKYDANCEGCTGRTYSGTEVKKGVCAVDPKVIKLGTNFYVDGYGLCRAEDIGGAIKGNRIDLGYPDAAKGEWRTGYTDIYLLTNVPE